MLFSITWNIYPSSTTDCLKAFGGMTPEDDEKDCGEDINMLGRWSAVDGSSGVCICETNNSSALFSWMANWTSVCDIKVTPVLTDAESRAVIKTKNL